ncbi:hypothetical protein, partial [Leptospira noguchii]|uniref:hypothetical protein n=1 Tax=Leptospira noguchii TaxID=28182 RepID=UPI00056B3639
SRMLFSNELNYLMIKENKDLLLQLGAPYKRKISSGNDHRRLKRIVWVSLGRDEFGSLKLE